MPPRRRARILGSRFRRAVGPVSILLSAGAIELLAQLGWRIPTPTPVLFTLLVLATYLGGRTSGLLSAGISILYYAHFYGIHGWLGVPSATEQVRVVELALFSVFIVLLLDALGRRTAARERERAGRVEAESLAERLEGIVQGLDAIVWEADSNTWDFRFVSRQAENILGYPVERWMKPGGAFFMEIVHPDDRERVWKICREATDRGEDHDLEYRMIAADGRVVWIRDLVRVVTDSNGKAQTSYGLLIDVTSQRETESSLRAAQSRLRLLFNEANDPVFLLELGPDGAPERILDLNEAAARTYGYSRSELLAIEPTQLIDPSVDPKPNHRRMAETGNLFADSLHVSKDGRRIPVEINAHRFELDGQPVVLSIVRDISDRKRAERELEQANRRLAATMNSITDGFLVLDRDGRFVYANRRTCQVLGATPEELIGRDIREAIPGFAGSEWETACRTAFDEQRTVQFETQGLVTRRWLEISIYPWSEGLAVYFRNVHDRKLAEARLAAEHAVTRVLAGSRSLDEAAPAILETLRRALAADVGELWVLDPAVERLRCAVSSADGRALEQFRRASERLTFARGEALPGRVWEQRRPVWVEDLYGDAGFGRTDAAIKEGLRSGIGFPILTGEEFFGVIELLTARPLERDEPLLNMMAAIGSEVGQFIQRCRAEEEARRLNRDLQKRVDELETLLSVVPIGIAVAQDPECNLITLNPAAAEMLGIPPSANASKSAPGGESLPFRVFQDSKEIPGDELPMQYAARHDVSVRDFEVDLVRQDGNVLRLFEYASPLHDEDGRVRGSLGVFVDITERQRTERALRESEERLRFILSAARVGTWEYTIETGEVRWSENLDEMHGRAPGSFGGTMDDVLLDVAEEDRERLIETIREALETGEFHIEYRLARSESGPRWVEGKGRVFYEEGRPVRMAGICMDISERKRAAEALDREHARVDLERRRLRAVLDALPVGVFIVDSGGRLLETNQAAREIWGGADPEKEKGGLYERRKAWWPETGDRVAPEEWGLARALRRGEISIGEELEIEALNGKRKTILSYALPVRDESGAILGGVAVNVEITGRKLAEEQLKYLNETLEQRVAERTAELARSESVLRSQSQILQSILDSIGDGVAVVDENGNLLVWNPAAQRISGADAITLQNGGASAGSVLLPDGESPDSPERFVLTRARRGESVDDAEIVLRRPDDEDRWLSVSARPLRDAEGRLRGGVATFRDITERKAAERKLFDYQHQLRSLASELTLSEQRERRRLAQLLHDHLQQLLAAAKLSLAAVEARADDGLRRSLRQVDELLDQSVEASRSLSIELSPPILYEAGLVPALQWLARQNLKQYGLHVAMNADPKAEPAAEDIRALLFQAVRELLFNVIKHSRTDRAGVEVSRPSEESLRVVVSDNGRGFDPAGLERTGATSDAFGLFSIRERLELLGGRMTIESAPGRGTRVTLIAPAHARAEAPAQVPSPMSSSRVTVRKARPRRRGEHIRVLLADDHRILREGLVELLADQPDMEVVGEASDGEGAIELARALRPDVIIMDLSMPHMNGIEATRIIARELPEIRIIGLSMHGEENLAAAMREAGAADYLTKGGPSHTLIASIREARQRVES